MSISMWHDYFIIYFLSLMISDKSDWSSWAHHHSLNAKAVFCADCVMSGCLSKAGTDYTQIVSANWVNITEEKIGVHCLVCEFVSWSSSPDRRSLSGSIKLCCCIVYDFSATQHVFRCCSQRSPIKCVQWIMEQKRLSSGEPLISDSFQAPWSTASNEHSAVLMTQGRSRPWQRVKGLLLQAWVKSCP